MKRKSSHTAPDKTIGRPVGSKREDTIARILDSALACFTSHGYASTKFKDIAVGANITSAAIYQYFDSKPALYIAVVDHIYQDIYPRFQQAIESSTRLKERIRNLVEAMVSLHEQSPLKSGFLSSIPLETQRHETLKEIFSHRENEMRALQARIFEDAIKNGEINPEWKVDNLVMMFFGSMSGMANYQLSVEGTSLRQAADIYLSMMESHLLR
ncbi:TetR/AcrR family transcriptional regulator [Spongiibacter sp. UBA1325]|uniref:TetR/AcrR family transcriptional regulator n=1 Tax=Spongiibacter sp. UBA1325 TaxID=1947543 RepID=UPI002580B661|nr:TetR/AcrR family transcriptional regulator [Spongiibacter sp. UBA1325]